MAGQEKENHVVEGQTPETEAAIEQNSQNRLRLPSEILGQVTWLMLQSPAHEHLFLADLKWLTAPAISLKQFRIFMQENTPVAFVSWAYLTEESEQRLLSGKRKLSPVEWKEGDRPWIIDIITPFGGTDEILRSVKKNIFPDQDVKTLVPGEDGKGVRVLTIRAKETEAEKAETKPKKAPLKKASTVKPRKTKKADTQAAE